MLTREWEIQMRLSGAVRAADPALVAAALAAGADVRALLPTQPNNKDNFLYPLQMLCASVRVKGSMFAHGGRAKYDEECRAILGALLAAGADLHAANDSDQLGGMEDYHRADLAPLAQAARQAPVELIAALLAAGSDADQVGRHSGEAALHVAAARVGRSLAAAGEEEDTDAERVFQALRAATSSRVASVRTRAGATVFSLLVRVAAQTSGEFPIRRHLAALAAGEAEPAPPLPCLIRLGGLTRRDGERLYGKVEGEAGDALREAISFRVEWGSRAEIHSPRTGVIYLRRGEMPAAEAALGVVMRRVREGAYGAPAGKRLSLTFGAAETAQVVQDGMVARLRVERRECQL